MTAAWPARSDANRLFGIDDRHVAPAVHEILHLAILESEPFRSLGHEGVDAWRVPA